MKRREVAIAALQQSGASLGEIDEITDSIKAALPKVNAWLDDDYTENDRRAVHVTVEAFLSVHRSKAIKGDFDQWRKRDRLSEF